MAAPFALPENTAAELLAMRLVLATFLETPDGARANYHAGGPLHQRAGLTEDLGAKLLALWTNRGWWSPTPSYFLGDPTRSGFLHFAGVAEAMSSDLWRDWFQGLTDRQALALVGELPEGFNAVGMDPACGRVWPAREGLPMLRCPSCGTRIKVKDAEPRVLDLSTPAPQLEPVISTVH